VSRTKSAAVQFSGAMVLMVLSAVQGLILVPLYLYYIGGYLYGAWLAIAGSVILFGLADMGISSLVVQQSAVFHSRADYCSLAKLVGTMHVVNALSIVIILILGFCFIPFIPQWLNVSSQYHHLLVMVAWLTVLDLVLMLLVNVSGAVLLGIQNPLPHMFASIIGTLISIIAIYLLLSLGFGVLALSVGALAKPLIVLPANMFNLNLFLSRNNVTSKVRFEYKMFKNLISKSLWLGPSKIAETLSDQVDNIIIARVLGVGFVTVLAVTKKVAELSVQVVGRVSASLLSGLSHLHGSGQEETQKQVIKTLLTVVVYAGGIALGGYLVFNESFVSMWIGSQYYGGNLLTCWIFIYCALKLLRISLYNIVFSVGEISLSAKSTVTEVSLQALLGLAFTIKMGLPGMVLGAILGVISATVMQLSALFSRRLISSSVIFKLFLKAGLSLICVVLPAYYISKAIGLQGWGSFTSTVLGYLLLSLFVVYIAERDLAVNMWGSISRQMRAAFQC